MLALPNAMPVWASGLGVVVGDGIVEYNVGVGVGFRRRCIVVAFIKCIVDGFDVALRAML